MRRGDASHGPLISAPISRPSEPLRDELGKPPQPLAILFVRTVAVKRRRICASDYFASRRSDAMNSSSAAAKLWLGFSLSPSLISA
jgi:hypothetical protein